MDERGDPDYRDLNLHDFICLGTTSNGPKKETQCFLARHHQVQQNILVNVPKFEFKVLSQKHPFGTKVDRCETHLCDLSVFLGAQFSPIAD